MPFRRVGDPPFVRRAPPRLAASHLRPVRPWDRVVAGLAVAVGLVLAVALAWVVLVVLRRPDAVGVSDELGARLDALVRRSLVADRVTAVVQWAGTACSLLVLGGTIHRALVLGPLRRAVLVGPGGPAARRWGRRVTSRRWSAEETVLRRAALVGMAAGAAALVLRTATLSDSSLFTTIVPSRLAFVVTSPFGVATTLRSAGMALTASAPHDRRSCLLGGLGILGSYGVVGHPQATGSPWSLLVAAQLVHVLVVATWFGGVAFLALDLRHRHRAGDPEGSAVVVTRFSTVASFTVVLAGATGVLLAWSQLGAVAALWRTPYGRALMAKLACVGMVVALGGYNRQFLVPAVAREDGEAAWHRFRRTVTAEALLMVLGVLLATAAMTSGGL